MRRAVHPRSYRLATVRPSTSSARRRSLSIRPDRFSAMGALSNDEIGSGLSAATLAAEQREKPMWLWESVHDAAEAAVRSKNKHSVRLRELLERRVLPFDSLSDAISANLAAKLAGHAMSRESFQSIFDDAFAEDPNIVFAAACDLERYVEIDPAADGHLSVFLFFKGFQAVQCARVASHLWSEPPEGRLLARMLQCRMSHTWGVDIHPGARLGRGVTLDHATGIVIGETAVVGDNVGFMHDVTLGATGSSPDHDRHPKVRDGVFLSAKCTVLGNIVVGEDAIVAANALVNKPVPPRHTAMGVPARMVPMTGLNHLPISDPMLRWSEGMRVPRRDATPRGRADGDSGDSLKMLRGM